MDSNWAAVLQLHTLCPDSSPLGYWPRNGTVGSLQCTMGELRATRRMLGAYRRNCKAFLLGNAAHGNHGRLPNLGNRRTDSLET